MRSLSSQMSKLGADCPCVLTCFHHYGCNSQRHLGFLVSHSTPFLPPSFPADTVLFRPKKSKPKLTKEQEQHKREAQREASARYREQYATVSPLHFRHELTLFSNCEQVLIAARICSTQQRHALCNLKGGDYLRARARERACESSARYRAEWVALPSTLQHPG